MWQQQTPNRSEGALRSPNQCKVSKQALPFNRSPTLCKVYLDKMQIFTVSEARSSILEIKLVRWGGAGQGRAGGCLPLIAPRRPDVLAESVCMHMDVLEVAYLSSQICGVCVNLFVNFLLEISTREKRRARHAK